LEKLGVKRRECGRKIRREWLNDMKEIKRERKKERERERIMTDT
jgi:hypothetical protein